MHNYKTAYSQSCNQSTEDLFKFWNNHLSQFVFICLFFFCFFLSSGVWSVCCLPNSNEWLSGTVWWTQWQRPITQLPGWFTFRWVCWSTLVPETARRSLRNAVFIFFLILYCHQRNCYFIVFSLIYAWYYTFEKLPHLQFSFFSFFLHCWAVFEREK